MRALIVWHSVLLALFRFSFKWIKAFPRYFVLQIHLKSKSYKMSLSPVVTTEKSPWFQRFYCSRKNCSQMKVTWHSTSFLNYFISNSSKTFIFYRSNTCVWLPSYSYEKPWLMTWLREWEDHEHELKNSFIK